MRSVRISAVPALVMALCLCGSPGLTADNVDGEAHFNAGLLHLRRGRGKAALDEFKAAIDADKDNPYYRKGAGLAYLQMEKYKDAEKSFRKALELNPYYVDVRNDLGTVLVLRGKREEGHEEFLKAFNDPQNPTPEMSARNLGRSFLEERDYSQALDWFRTSLGINPEYADAHIGVSDTLRALGRRDEAIAQLELGVEKAPDVVTIHLALGEALFGVGRFAEAREQLEWVAGRDPGGAWGLRAVELLKRFPE